MAEKGFGDHPGPESLFSIISLYLPRPKVQRDRKRGKNGTPPQATKQAERPPHLAKNISVLLLLFWSLCNDMICPLCYCQFLVCIFPSFLAFPQLPHSTETKTERDMERQQERDQRRQTEQTEADGGRERRSEWG